MQGNEKMERAERDRLLKKSWSGEGKSRTKSVRAKPRRNIKKDWEVGGKKKGKRGGSAMLIPGLPRAKHQRLSCIPTRREAHHRDHSSVCPLGAAEGEAALKDRI